MDEQAPRVGSRGADFIHVELGPGTRVYEQRQLFRKTHLKADGLLAFRVSDACRASESRRSPNPRDGGISYGDLDFGPVRVATFARP